MKARFLWTSAWVLMLACAAGASDLPAQAGLAEALKKARPIAVGSLGVPVTSVIAYSPWLVANPDGKTYDVLQWYYRNYGGPTRVYIVDLATGQVTKDRIPDRLQLHMAGKALGPDGKRYFVTPSRAGMELFVYDPAANAIDKRGVIAPGLGGETRRMDLGPDGMIYGTGSYGRSRKAGLYRLDPKTGEVRDYGPIGPSHAPNGCWGYYIKVDDRFAYVASGKIPWYLVAVDLATGADKVLLKTRPFGKTLISLTRTAGAVRTRVTDGDAVREYWLHHGKAIPKTGDKPPFEPARRPAPPTPPAPEIHHGQIMPDADGNALLWYRTAEDARAAEAEAGGSRPEDLGWKSAKLTGVETYPVKVHRLVALPDGTLFGTCSDYQGSFRFDPKTGKSTHLGKGGASPYAYAISGGMLYWSGYPSGGVYRYDPSRPWTLNAPSPPGRRRIRQRDKDSNPRMFGYLHPHTRAKKMFKAAVGADGRVYIGGIGQRDYHGGSFGWIDTKTGALGGMWRPFSGYKIHAVIAADGGKSIVLSTRTVRDELAENVKGADGKIFVWDVETRKIVREIVPVPGQTRAGPIIEVRPGVVLGATRDPKAARAGIVYSVDIRTGRVLFRRPVPRDCRYAWSNGISNNDLTAGPDGRGYTFMGNALVRIEPADGRIDVLGRLSRPGRITFLGRDAYLTGLAELRVIRNLIGPTRAQ